MCVCVCWIVLLPAGSGLGRRKYGRIGIAGSRLSKVVELSNLNQQRFVAESHDHIVCKNTNR